MKMRSNKKMKSVAASKLTRSRAEKISAVEGMKLSRSMAGVFENFDRDGLSGEERRKRLLTQFQKKTA